MTRSRLAAFRYAATRTMVPHVLACTILLVTAVGVQWRHQGLVESSNAAVSLDQDVTVRNVSDRERTAWETFVQMTDALPQNRLQALREIVKNWHDGDAAMVIESTRFARDRVSRDAMLRMLAKRTGQSDISTQDEWYEWLWNQTVDSHPDYAEFKRALYANVDPRFAEYFSNDHPTKIRLDEVVWGGVMRDGIPPLKNPKTMPADQATYLADTDVVFGVEFNGHARAYPKRILAWHEMVKDVVGGESINGVYCTLCGSMIVYHTEHQGKHYELGTSGFLYRSNKLMYDHETKSMWSTLRGIPVIGPLVDQGIQLRPLYVVTTTWGKWKELHPETDVLTANTGHRRDYREGAAYARYFATDELMFGVPKLDRRLKNKDEILVIRDDQPIAIAAKFLRKNPVYPLKVGDRELVVITDSSGANRVYESRGIPFQTLEDETVVVAEDGSRWQWTEAALEPMGEGTADQHSLPRAAAHRAFWFGWKAAYPEGELIH